MAIPSYKPHFPLGSTSSTDSLPDFYSQIRGPKKTSFYTEGRAAASKVTPTPRKTPPLNTPPSSPGKVHTHIGSAPGLSAFTPPSTGSSAGSSAPPSTHLGLSSSRSSSPLPLPIDPPHASRISAYFTTNPSQSSSVGARRTLAFPPNSLSKPLVVTLPASVATLPAASAAEIARRILEGAS